MLVDLGRNDLGRVCRPGTVEVVEFMDVRRYSHIMHLESTVTGQLAADRYGPRRGAGRLPGRHPVGAPKVRAMEIIDELEVSRRGLYGGVVGYLDFAGDADAAIAIRTAAAPRRRGLRPGRRRHRGRLGPADRGPGDPEQGRRGGPGRSPSRSPSRRWHVSVRLAPSNAAAPPTRPTSLSAEAVGLRGSSDAAAGGAAERGRRRRSPSAGSDATGSLSQAPAAVDRSARSAARASVLRASLVAGCWPVLWPRPGCRDESPWPRRPAAPG